MQTKPLRGPELFFWCYEITEVFPETRDLIWYVRLPHETLNLHKHCAGYYVGNISVTRSKMEKETNQPQTSPTSASIFSSGDKRNPWWRPLTHGHCLCGLDCYSRCTGTHSQGMHSSRLFLILMGICFFTQWYRKKDVYSVLKTAPLATLSEPNSGSKSPFTRGTIWVARRSLCLSRMTFWSDIWQIWCITLEPAKWHLV